VTRLAVIDHGAGNLVSVARGLEKSGARVDVVREPSGLAACDGVVLPGVGTTGAAMERLQSQDLVEALDAWKGPLLGICVGLQLFFDTSDEDDTKCLGFMAGRVARLESAPLLPHIGWNDVELAADAIGWSEYGGRFVAAARRGNRVGVQFHPERSGEAGLAVLANFITECQRGRRAA
jgi:glutamine amidotransferase